jgi:hypothetical protein
MMPWRIWARSASTAVELYAHAFGEQHRQKPLHQAAVLSLRGADDHLRHHIHAAFSASASASARMVAACWSERW